VSLLRAGGRLMGRGYIPARTVIGKKRNPTQQMQKSLPIRLRRLPKRALGTFLKSDHGERESKVKEDRDSC